MRFLAFRFYILGLAMTAGCTNMTVEEVGSFKLNGETYVIKSTTPGNTSEANAREQATYSVKVNGGTLNCDGSTSDCRAAVEQQIRDHEDAEGVYG